MIVRTLQGRVRVDVVVTDLDRTLTDEHLRVVPAALRAVARARHEGVRTVLATGRTIGEIRRRPRLMRSFDALVLEGGALTGTPEALERVAVPEGEFDELQAWLLRQGLPFRRGAAEISVRRKDAHRVRRFRGLGRFALHPNRDRLDITCRGIDKGSGLRRVLGAERRRLRVLAFGDAENDLPLFDASDHTVAVENAVPALKDRADEVCPGYGGRGVAAYLEARAEAPA